MELKNLEIGKRIDVVLTNILELSRSTIAKMIKEEYVLVNNKATKANYIIRENDVINIIDGFKKELDVSGEDIKLDIVYEDDDIIVINKESGMVVHPGNGNVNHTLVNALKYHTDKLSSINGEFRPGIVHRIDKDTSGLMIVAKNDKTHQILSDNLSRHEIKRTYIALVVGEFLSDTATIDAPIGRDIKNRKKMAVTSKNSKYAITHLTTLKRYKGYTLLELNLETGRTHQIRVHLDYIGYPIYNDPVYSKSKCSEFGQFLHSKSIEFIHPITNEKMYFTSSLPEEFTSFLDTLEEK